ncbi:MAG: hypothetical protein QOD07_1680 [Frankiaceae bacterium]|jgi:hypothetical protein|nr:hypothetical protein [Frankiaceae bacterium]
MTALPPDAETQQHPDAEDEPSGVPAADDAAERLRDLDAAPVDQHVAIYEDAHRRLEEGLADLDER